MKKILMIVQAIDEASGEVEQNFTLEVCGQDQKAVDVFAADLTQFGQAETDKALRAGADKKNIKAHHYKKK